MQKPLFRYKQHPGDLYRNTDLVELPNPDENLEGFLIWFLRSYQSDSRVTYVDDLYKLLHNEFSNEEDRMELLQQVGTKTEMEIQGEIKLVEEELKMEAYKNFYQLLLSNKIELA
jgi:hypothetical protein